MVILSKNVAKHIKKAHDKVYVDTKDKSCKTYNFQTANPKQLSVVALFECDFSTF